MVDKATSAEDDATTPTGTELLRIVQGGTNKKITAAGLLTRTSVTDGDGLAVTISGGDGSENGGPVNITGGASTGSGYYNGGSVNINGGAGTSVYGGNIVITSGIGASYSGDITIQTAMSGTEDAGAINLHGGTGMGSDSDGGLIQIVCGDGGGTGNGGNLNINAGNGATTGSGGNLALVAGASSGGAGGNVNIASGGGTPGGEVVILASNAAFGSDGNGGNLSLYIGQKDGAGANGNLLIVGLPTSDPAVAGAVWNNAGTLKISAG